MEDVVEELLSKAEKYNVITFDVFDTLIIRDLRKPVDLFDLQGGRIYKYKRIMAEIAARKKSNKEDVTLEEIYKFLKGKDINIECGLEKKICRANPRMKVVYDRLKAQGKKIYVISDMYLSKQLIYSILNNAGFDMPKDNIFVSSEYGVTKVSGKLFNKFCELENIDRRKILHIGDSEIADKNGSEIAGIDSFLIRRDKWNLKYSKVSRENMMVTGFVNHNINYIDNYCERIGYEILGPILVSFCQWLKKSFEKYKYDKMFFLARDMYLPYTIFTKLYGKENVDYLKISRKSLRNSANHPDNFLKYLKKHGCFGNVAIVDTGWRGIMQLLIDYYAKQIDNSTEISGLYIGWNSVFKHIVKFGKNDNCFSESKKMQRKMIIYATFLESLLGKEELKAIDYDDDGKEIYDENVRSVKDIEHIQAGALLFAKEWNERGNFDINAKLAFESFCRLCDRPEDRDIDILANAEFDDVEISKLVKYENRKYYRFRLKKWLNDLRFSAWKGAFFKKSFRLYKPIYDFYFFSDSLMLSVLTDMKMRGKGIDYFINFY